MRILVDVEFPTHEFDRLEELVDSTGVEDAGDLLDALLEYYDPQAYGNGHGIGQFISDCGLMDGASISFTMIDDDDKPVRTSARWGDRVSIVTSTVV